MIPNIPDYDNYSYLPGLRIATAFALTDFDKYLHNIKIENNLFCDIVLIFGLSKDENRTVSKTIDEVVRDEKEVKKIRDYYTRAEKLMDEIIEDRADKKEVREMFKEGVELYKELCDLIV